MEPTIDPPDPTPDSTGGPEVDPPVKLIEFRDYADAQAAVDRLSDLGFPVANVSIVWRGLSRVEHVTGRRTVATAAGEGASAGAWFGALIGLLMATLTELPESTSILSVVLAYLVVGAAAGALWLGVGHAMRRGSRDFSTAPILDAEAYELWVEPDLAARATELLQLRTR